MNPNLPFTLILFSFMLQFQTPSTMTDCLLIFDLPQDCLFPLHSFPLFCNLVFWTPFRPQACDTYTQFLACIHTCALLFIMLIHNLAGIKIKHLRVASKMPKHKILYISPYPLTFSRHFFSPRALKLKVPLNSPHCENRSLNVLIHAFPECGLH